MPEQDPLAQLRDIHLPDPIGWWPPAIGWWLAGALLLAALLLLAYQWLIHRRRNRYRKLALAQLKQLELQSLGNEQALQQLNQLLKQTALAAGEAGQVAGLSGQQWLAFLDQSGNTKDFSEGVGQPLKDGPYSPTTDAVNIAELQQLARRWIKQHRLERSQVPTC